MEGTVGAQPGRPEGGARGLQGLWEELRLEATRVLLYPAYGMLVSLLQE